ncbi:hypothetical protein GCM10023259_018170 [Thermocatellispora tengchongensis]
MQSLIGDLLRVARLDAGVTGRREAIDDLRRFTRLEVPALAIPAAPGSGCRSPGRSPRPTAALPTKTARARRLVRAAPPPPPPRTLLAVVLGGGLGCPDLGDTGGEGASAGGLRVPGGDRRAAIGNVAGSVASGGEES